MRNYLSYLKNVLGAREILWPYQAVEEVVSASSHEEPGTSLRVLFLTSAPWGGSEKELFSKITEAMKLAKDSFKVKETTPEHITEVLADVKSARNVVCFSFELKSALEVLGFSAHFSPDPKSMIKNPGLKKEAWEVLKKL